MVDGTNKIKIAGQPGVNLPAVFCVIGNYSVMFLLHKNAPHKDEPQFRHFPYRGPAS